MQQAPSESSSLRAASSSRDFTFDTIDQQPGTAKPRMAPKRLFQHVVGSAIPSSYFVDYATLVVLAIILVWSETAEPFTKVFYIKDDQVCQSSSGSRQFYANNAMNWNRWKGLICQRQFRTVSIEVCGYNQASGLQVCP